MLAVFVVIVAAVIFFAVKGISAINSKPNEEIDNPIGTAGVVDSTENSGEETTTPDNSETATTPENGGETAAAD